MNASITNRIVLGTVQFGLNYGISNSLGKTPLNEVTEILTFAEQQQIDMLDTAAAYGDSEEVIGEYADSAFQIISKFVETREQASVSASLQTSLKNLKRHSIYAYLSHHANTLLEHPAHWDELLQLKAEQRVKKIGYSLYTTSELENLLQLKMIPDLVQLPFNLVDQRFLPYFQQLKDLSVEIHVRSAFLQGLLLMNTKGLHAFFGPVKPVLEKLIEQFPSISDRAAALILFCLEQKAIDKVVIGVNTKVQLEENLVSLLTGVPVDKDFQIGYIPESILMPNYWPK